MKISGIAIGLVIITMMQFTLHAHASSPPSMKWNKTYGGDKPDGAYFVQQTNDNGYIIAGYTRSSGAGSSDFWVVKTDSNGNTQWNKTYGGIGRDEAYSVQQTSEEGYIIAGSTRSFGAGLSDFWLVKTDSNGEIVWNKTYGGPYYEEAYSVQQTSDGGYIAAGSTNSLGSEDFWLVKTGPDGGMQWNKTFGGFFDDIAFCTQQTNDGGYIVCGYAGSLITGFEDFWLLKTDSDGNEIWNKTYGGDNSDYAHFVQQTSDNGYVIAGSTYSSSTAFDVWLIKTDSSGNMQWNKTYGGALDEEAYAVQQTSDGGYIIAGFTDSFSDNRDVWLIKTDSSGNTEWNQTYGGAEKDEAYSVQQTNGNGYIIAGTTYSFGSAWDPDSWLIRLASSHDIAVQDLVPYKHVVGEGYSVFVNVTIKNWGESGTFNVTVYVNTTKIWTQHVTLANGDSAKITFTWNTTGFIKGNYAINAYAWPVPDETDIEDNTYTDGWVFVAMVGDVNADGIVDIEDIYSIALAYGTTPGQLGYKPNQDINGDGIIDIEDIYTAALHYGETSL